MGVLFNFAGEGSNCQKNSKSSFSGRVDELKIWRKEKAACHLVDPFRECGLRVSKPEPRSSQLGDLAGSSSQSAPWEMHRRRRCHCRCCPGEKAIQRALLGLGLPLRQACSHGLAGKGRFPVWFDRILHSNLFVPGFLPSGPNMGIMGQTLVCISVTSRWVLIRTSSFKKGSTVLPHLLHRGPGKKG